MSWESVEGALTVTFDPLWTTVIALLLLLLGYWLKKEVKFFETFCIPAPVLGGLLMALVALAVHHSGGHIKFTTSLQTPMMLAFFTTVGIGGSFGLLKRGGKALIAYLVFCWCLAVIQNVVGSGLAKTLGIHPVLGIMAGAVSLEGGHGAAASFGAMVEGMGITGASAVAIASATFGLIAGGLLGGPVAVGLIRRNKVKIEASQEEIYQQNAVDLLNGDGEDHITSHGFLKMLGLVLVCMAVGALLGGKIKEWSGFSLPGYVSAMFVAVVLRNLNDKLGWITIRSKSISLISDVSIGVFLTMAMMSLRIWDLYDLAGPLCAILAVQTVLLALLTIFILFPLLGKDYDAAVMCAGVMGHGLGATPNAVANMGAMCERYGVMSHKAFLIVPLCGAVLIDLVGLPNIVWFINYFVK